MSSRIEQSLKQKRIENSSEEFKKNYKLKTLENIIKELDTNSNRYIFYCPDIILVNSLVKLIYETAYEVHKAGFKVVILHEMNGFKCNWLLKDSNYKHLKDIPVDYVITKKGSKTKRTSNNYTFKPSDTLIVPDQFLEMFENLIELKTIQKVLLVTSYVGLSAIQPGVTLNQLGVDRVIFTEPKLKDDYLSLFNDLTYFELYNYPINDKVFVKQVEKEVLPLITVSQIGNNDFVQQVINVFYNKYPNLRVFNFRLLDRNSIEIYLENFKKAAACLILDKNLNSLQMIDEVLSMGCPVLTNNRVEIDSNLGENLFIGNNAFEIADNLALFCQTWLGVKTSFINEKAVSLTNISEKNYEQFGENVTDILKHLKTNRETFFKSMKV